MKRRRLPLDIPKWPGIRQSKRDPRPLRLLTKRPASTSFVHCAQKADHCESSSAENSSASSRAPWGPAPSASVSLARSGRRPFLAMLEAPHAPHAAAYTTYTSRPTPKTAAALSQDTAERGSLSATRRRGHCALPPRPPPSALAIRASPSHTRLPVVLCVCSWDAGERLSNCAKELASQLTPPRATTLDARKGYLEASGMNIWREPKA
ncbi:hypothetical protein PtB15_10B200 [Puccinia triticina]|nr:hypothetical protein PtB15_10B200 [Puccinia triticina]